MRISAVIPTHNRAQYLGKAIQSLAGQTLEPTAFEILVIDNASSDQTAKLVADMRADVPNLVYIHESRLGLNNARNAGWQNARSQIVAFLDDDAVAESNWLETIVRKFQKFADRVAAIGGRIDPLWEEPPPAWLCSRYWPFLSVLDLADHDLLMDKTHYFVGANMAFRKAALAAVGGFHPHLDRRGRSLLSNGELHLKHLLETADFQSYYCPEVRLRHLVPKERMTEAWFRQRYYWQGISDRRMETSYTPQSGGLAAWTKAFLRTSRATAGFLRRTGVARLKALRIPRSLDAQFSEKYQLGVFVERWSELLVQSR